MSASFLGMDQTFSLISLELSFIFTLGKDGIKKSILSLLPLFILSLVKFLSFKGLIETSGIEVWLFISLFVRYLSVVFEIDDLSKYAPIAVFFPVVSSSLVSVSPALITGLALFIAFEFVRPGRCMAHHYLNIFLLFSLILPLSLLVIGCFVIIYGGVFENDSNRPFGVFESAITLISLLVLVFQIASVESYFYKGLLATVLFLNVFVRREMFVLEEIKINANLKLLLVFLVGGGLIAFS